MDHYCTNVMYHVGRSICVQLMLFKQTEKHTEKKKTDGCSVNNFSCGYYSMRRSFRDDSLCRQISCQRELSITTYCSTKYC